MASPAIDEGLRKGAAAVEAGRGLGGTGFWKAVSEVKGDPELVDRYAERIAVIDSGAFRQWAMLVVPLGLGTSLMVLATVAALVSIGWAYYLDGFAAVVVFYVGFGALLVTTHGLGHLVVGTLLGIRFRYWFLGPPSFPITGGVKIDYTSYLKASPRSRAWMHAAGAITTKLVPFALIAAAIATGLPTWAVWLLPAIGLAAILTDVYWSTSKSDWKRFKREMAFAQDS